MQTRTQSQCKVSSNWLGANNVSLYRSGVSLHSHTSMSEETLTFIHKGLALLPGLGRMLAHYDHKTKDRGFELDPVRGHWRPPLVPRMAYELEAAQIRNAGLEPLVAITDHDTIAAPQLLRNVPSARGIPVSLEWTVPFGVTEFHLGIHNLPSGEAFTWTARLATYTAAPSEGGLRAILAELDELPGVLVILNHPVWDLHKIGAEWHRRELVRFLDLFGGCLHALELNGLRDARENRAVAQIARETGHLLISGGDRHGMEPSACINLSQASSASPTAEAPLTEGHGGCGQDIGHRRLRCHSTPTERHRACPAEQQRAPLPYRPENDPARRVCPLAQPPLAGREDLRLAQGTGPLRQVKLRGLAKVDWIFVFSCAAHNLLRLPRLLATLVQHVPQAHVAG